MKHMDLWSSVLWEIRQLQRNELFRSLLHQRNTQSVKWMHSKTDNSLLATAASVRCGHFMVSANFRVDADCAHIVIGVTLPFFLSSSSVLFFSLYTLLNSSFFIRHVSAASSCVVRVENQIDKAPNERDMASNNEIHLFSFNLFFPRSLFLFQWAIYIYACIAYVYSYMRATNISTESLEKREQRHGTRRYDAKR